MTTQTPESAMAAVAGQAAVGLVMLSMAMMQSGLLQEQTALILAQHLRAMGASFLSAGLDDDDFLEAAARLEAYAGTGAD